MNIHTRYQACIDACNACAAACNACLVACLKEDDVKMMQRCIALDTDCAAICSLAAHAMARDSEMARHFCRVCSEVCLACANECSQHAHDHCQQCADACKHCAKPARQWSIEAKLPGFKPAPHDAKACGTDGRAFAVAGVLDSPISAFCSRSCDGKHNAGDVAGTRLRRQENIGRRDFSGCAGRRMSVLAPNCTTSSAVLSAGLSGVQTGPGATAFTRILRSAKLLASALVNAWIAPFVAE
jgi:hypothetical protein